MSLGASKESQPMSCAGGIRGKKDESLSALWTALMRTAVPLSFSHWVQYSITTVMLTFVGHIGIDELGGASIALGMINAIALACGGGLSGALETLFSQSFGMNRNSILFVAYAERMVGIMAVCSIPLSLIHLFLEDFLLWLGEPPIVARYAGRFSRIGLFALPLLMLLELLRRFYACQHLTKPLCVALAIAAVLNPVLLGMNVFSFGYDGVPLTWVTLMLGIVLGLIVHLWFIGMFHRPSRSASQSTRHQWSPILSLALPSLVTACSQWAVLEVNFLVSGFGTPTELAAYTISAQVLSFCSATVSGLFLSTTIMVGNMIGRGRPLAARRCAGISVACSLAMALFNTTFVFTFRDGIARIFTEDEDVIDLFCHSLPYILAFHILDASQCSALAVLRGCGMQMFGVIMVVLGLTAVGMPLGAYCFLYRDAGVEWLWIGPFCGYILISLPGSLYVAARRIPWVRLTAHLKEGDCPKVL